MRHVLITQTVDHAEFVSHLWQVLPEFAHRNTVFPGRAKLPGGSQQVTARSKLDTRTLERRFLAVVFLQLGLGIEKINVGWSTVHEQEDDPLGSRPEVRFSGGQRVCREWWGGKSLAV